MILILWRLLKLHWIKMELRVVNGISKRLEESNRKERLHVAALSEENECN